MEFLEKKLDKYRYVVFDLDGTIVNLYVDWKCLKEELHGRFGINFNILNDGLKQLDSNKLTIAFKIIGKYENSAYYNVNLPVVEYIRKYHKNYAIFSDNMSSTISKILDELGIIHKFEIIVGKDSVKNFKPHEEGLIKIINYFNDKYGNLNHTKIVYIGDSKKDETVAKKINITFFKIRS